MSSLQANRKQQQGVVIVVALFIVALVATMAYVMMARLERDTHRTTLLVRNTQAEFYVQGSITWAMDQLRSHWEKQKSNQLIDTLPMQAPMITINGYDIASTLYDAQARFNLNNLTKQTAQDDFKHLIKLVSPRLAEENTQAITQAVVNWITPTAEQPEFDQYYLELALPYRAAHRHMISASELRLVKGMTALLYSSLQPYIIALPGTTTINVQTAPAVVLATLSPTFNLTIAQSIERLRKQTPITSAQQFLDLEMVKNLHIPPDKITVNSSYFLLETQVKIANQRATLYTLLERAIKDNKAAIIILWQGHEL